MSGVHARRRTDDRYLHGLRAVSWSLAGLSVLAVVTLPATRSLGRSAAPAAQEAQQAQAISPPRVGSASHDPERSGEWWLDLLHLPSAWQMSRGQGVTVAVLDTGVDGHDADLTGQVTQGPDYTTGGRTPDGRYWGHHGTSIAGIIAGHGHGPGSTAGILGIAPAAKILSIRVTWETNDPIRQTRGAALADRSSLAQGIRYAVDHGASVINMSLGGSSASFDGTPDDVAAINYALGKGVVLVASMGNDGAPPTKRYFPAAYPGVIAVGAVGRSLKPWKDSNRGPYVAVAAPGVGIVSDDISDGYQITDGTSASSAIVAGVAALIRSQYPSMPPAQVARAVETGVTHQPPGGHNDQVGAGVVDAAKALQVAALAGSAPGGSAPALTNTPHKAIVVASDKSTNLLLIGILTGGGALVVLGLVLGWLQRRRPEDDDEPLLDEPPASPIYTSAADSVPGSGPDFVPSSEPTRPPVLPAAETTAGLDPLDGPPPTTLEESPTPLAEQSWQTVRDRLDEPHEIPEDFPAVGPVTDPPSAEPVHDVPIRRLRPHHSTVDNQDVRPPWL
jgi:type VII secretion-associated serine protease mycosin